MSILEKIENKNYYLSQSRLKKLIGEDYNPKNFLKEEYKSKEELGEALVIGLAVESLACDFDDFDDKFLVSDFKPDLTSNASKIKKIMNYLIENNLSIKDNAINASEIFEYYTSMNEEKRLEKIIKEGSDYYNEYLKLKGSDKFVVSTEKFDICKQMSQGLKTNTITKDYFKSHENIEYWDQCDSTFKYENIECRLIIDRLIVDHKNKTVQVLDIKTGSKGFIKSAKEHRYDIQGAFYWLGINDIEDFKDYKQLNPIFIYSNVYDPDNPELWEMSDWDLEGAIYGIERVSKQYVENSESFPSNKYKIEGIKDLVKKYKYHIDNGWDVSIYGSKRKMNLWV